jgi:hypothetical protein
MANNKSTRYDDEYDRIHAALPGWAHDTSDVPLSACVKAAFTALELQVERLTLERDEARRKLTEQTAVREPVECPYERLDDDALYRAIRLKQGERVLVLQPFGWHIDGSHIPNAPEQFEREYICSEHGWEVVHEFGPYVAIVRPKAE